MHEKQRPLMYEKKAAEKPNARGGQHDLLASALEYKSRTGIYSFPAAHSNITIFHCFVCLGARNVAIDLIKLIIFRIFDPDKVSRCSSPFFLELRACS